MKKTIALLLVALPVLAQKPAPVEVKLVQINDRRTSGSFSQLNLSLELPKILSKDVEASRVLIASATDDSGASLLDPEASEPSLDPNFRGTMKSDPNEPPPVLSLSVTLKNPERSATSLKEVRGEIELFMPSKDPNSVAEIPKFTSTSGKPLTHKALKANGIEMALLSTKQIEAERKRIADEKRKEYKDQGWEDDASLDETIKNMSESFLSMSDGDVLMRIKDPNKRIHEIAYVDAAGEVKRVSRREDEGVFFVSTWEGAPKPDWKLRVSMKTSKNIVRHSFALKDIALP